MTTTPSSHKQPMTGKTKDGPSGAGMQRRVDAPFDLRTEYNAMNNHDNTAFFNTTFPGNKGYSFDGLFLYVYLNSPHPSVQFFAGVPVIFIPPQRIPHAYPSPLPHGFYVAPRQGSIACDLNYRDRPGQDPHWQPLFDTIRSYFETINVNPNEGQSPDNTEYEVLRPGVRVSSDFLPGTEVYRSSTLGARVHDANGNVFITVAAHTFPADDALIFHPLRPGGRPIGQLAGRVGTTDVALLSLDPQQRFSNEVFISTSYEEEDASPQIRGLGQAKRYDVVTLDAPDTGVLYGSVIGFSKRCLSGIEGDNETSWVDITYIFVGENNDGILPDRMCGAVVRSQDQNVVSFFQYQMVGRDWRGTWATALTLAFCIFFVLIRRADSHKIVEVDLAQTVWTPKAYLEI